MLSLWKSSFKARQSTRKQTHGQYRSYLSISSERISHLNETLWKPFNNRADEQQNAQEQKQNQQLSNCSHPISSMRLNEVWAECKLRLSIESKEDLYETIKSIDYRLSCEMGLNKDHSVVTRLKHILKVLRRENVMLAREGQQDESSSQCPAQLALLSTLRYQCFVIEICYLVKLLNLFLH